MVVTEERSILFQSVTTSDDVVFDRRNGLGNTMVEVVGLGVMIETVGVVVVGDPVVSTGTSTTGASVGGLEVV